MNDMLKVSLLSIKTNCRETHRFSLSLVGKSMACSVKAVMKLFVLEFEAQEGQENLGSFYLDSSQVF